MLGDHHEAQPPLGAHDAGPSQGSAARACVRLPHPPTRNGAPSLAVCLSVSSAAPTAGHDAARTGLVSLFPPPGASLSFRAYGREGCKGCPPSWPCAIPPTRRTRPCMRRGTVSAGLLSTTHGAALLVYICRGPHRSDCILSSSMQQSSLSMQYKEASLPGVATRLSFTSTSPRHKHQQHPVAAYNAGASYMNH